MLRFKAESVRGGRTAGPGDDDRIRKQIRVRNQYRLAFVVQHGVTHIDVSYSSIEASHADMITVSEGAVDQQQDACEDVREDVAERKAEGEPGESEAGDERGHVYSSGPERRHQTENEQSRMRNTPSI